MSGLSFLHTVFLAGLATIAVPILIHLLFKRQKRTVVFSTLRFLRRVTEEKARRLRLQEWLLLALRVLIFVLITLAFARPFFSENAVRTPSRTDLVVVLDDSYSMGVRGDAGIRLDAAQRKALELLEELSEGDRAALITTSGGVVRRALTQDLDQVREAVRKTSSSFEFCRYWPAVRRGHGLLGGPGAGRGRIVLITDGQLVSWDGMSEVRELEGFGKSFALEVVRIEAGSAGNLALLDARVPARIWSKGEPLRIVARVAHYGKRPLDQVLLRLTWRCTEAASDPDGSGFLEKTISVEPEEIASASFLFHTPRKDDLTGEIEVVSEDELPADNRFFFSISAEDAVRVLCVEESIASKPFLQATYYLRRALEPVTADDTESPGYVRTQVVPVNLLPSAALGGIHVVILANVPEVSVEVSERLESFVRGGGGLVFFAGAQVQAGSYNDRAYRGGAGWLPGSFEAGDGEDRPWDRFMTLLPLDRAHELFRPYGDEEWTELSSGRFYRYLSVKPAPDAKCLASYDNDAPAILERRVGEGRVILFTSSCDPEWTDLPKRGIYVPLMHQLVRYLAPRDRESRSNLLVGEALSAALGRSLLGPGLETLSARDGDGKALALNEPVTRPGLYALIRADEHRAARRIAVNLNTRESHPALVEGSEIAALTQQPEGPAADLDAAGQTRWEDRGRASPWWRYLLLAAIVLLILELVLANGWLQRNG
ncbi:MAG: BatA domain-containing protein [Planctomycetes bacterium]|nr:BatA domain-containing protein [Planctomycetota bacterium]